MGDYRLQAFHDPKANPVATSYVQTRSCIDDWAPKLAEEAGLGRLIGRGYTQRATANLQYENGVILVHKEHQHKYGEGA
jgi:hypothetical protein